jgi:hypothetical protein
VVISLRSHGGILDWDGPGGARLAQRMSELCGLPLDHGGYQSYITGSLGRYEPAEYHIPVITVELNGPRLTQRLRAALLAAAQT